MHRALPIAMLLAATPMAVGAGTLRPDRAAERRERNSGPVVWGMGPGGLTPGQLADLSRKNSRRRKRR